MSRKIVHVVGTGTIGEPLIGLLSDFKDKLGIDEITFHKNSPVTTDRSKVKNLMKRGARLTTHEDKFDGFNSLGLKPEFTTEQAIDRASVVIDCTPKGYGHKNKADYYEKFLHNTKGFIAQGSEIGFGKMYARGINDHVITKEDQFLQIVSCNTHNLACLVNTIALSVAPDNLLSGKFLCIRRSNDISQTSSFVPAPTVNDHSDNIYGTHHAKDAAGLFKTMNLDLNLFSSALKVNSQYMHVVWFNLELKEQTDKEKVLHLLQRDKRVALTEHHSANTVFSFGRDQGQYGRLLNQTVVVEDSINIKNGNEVTGFCFTPQDGNSLLSSIAVSEWFLYPNSYEDKIQCLKPFFFDEV